MNARPHRVDAQSPSHSCAYIVCTYFLFIVIFFVSSRRKLEKMKEEEKRLSDLEAMRKKQQADVADLMRLASTIILSLYMMFISCV